MAEFLLDFSLESSLSLVTQGGQFLALDFARRPKAKILDDEGVVVLLFALFVRPVVGANLRLKNELVALACVSCDRLPQGFESHEPETGGDLARIALIILARIVVSHQTKPCVGGIPFDGKLRILGEITNRGYAEAVHDYSLAVVLRDSRLFLRRVAGSLRAARGQLNPSNWRVYGENTYVRLGPVVSAIRCEKLMVFANFSTPHL